MWTPNFASARWIGNDLAFNATTDAGIVRYVVRARRLRNIAQRTGAEALHSNILHLKSEMLHASPTSDGVITIA